MINILCRDIIINIYENINLIDILNLSLANKYLFYIFKNLSEKSWEIIAKLEYHDYYWLFLENMKLNNNFFKKELYELNFFKSKYEKIDKIDSLILFYIFKLIKL